MVSPVFSLVGYTAASANFFYFYRDIGDTGDSAVVETSTNGTTWAIAQAFVATTGLPAGFVSASVPLTSVLGQATVQVRFRYKGTWDYYWCVDNFSVNAASAPTFAWAGSPGGYSSAVQNPTGVPVTAPSTTYTVTVTAANSCTATANTTVNVGSGSPPDVTIAAGGPTTFCSGGSVLLTASITDGCPAFTYVWSDGMNTVGTNSPTYSATASGTYSVSITDASSQTDVSNSIVVTVNPTPVATAGSNSPVCIGQPLDLTGSSSEGGSSFSWTGPLGLYGRHAEPAGFRERYGRYGRHLCADRYGRWLPFRT
ncbi:MAG: hypothetical protein IPG10_04270, partial [Flavobacteriales bacterium]|nr:hypothetical protein [Flavobacteriales bacterium]